jgi:hypothetical protein
MADTIGKFVGNTVGEAAAFAAGIAVGPLLAPLLRALENETWSQYPDQPIAPGTLAQGVAQRKVDPGTAADEARLSGLAATPFAALVDIMRTAPSVAEALQLIRRGQMPFSEFPTVLQRAGLEDQWLAFFEALSTTGLQPYETPLSPADLALGLIRSNLPVPEIDGQPIFPLGGSTEGSIVPHDAVASIDVFAEAAASGMDAERMATLARNVGLPPGVIEGLRMLNRGIIDEPSFYLLIEQSDARLSWGEFLIQLRREVLGPHTYAELRVRDWIDDPTMYAGTALSGVTPEDTDLMVKNIGRPLAVHQVTTGLARGGVYPGLYANVPEPFRSAIAQSNIREEWAELAYANRYTLPSPFVLKALATGGDLSQPETETLLLDSGWPPDLAASVSRVWAPAAAVVAKPKKLTNATIRSLLRKGDITQEDALSRVEANGLTAADALLYLEA